MLLYIHDTEKKVGLLGTGVQDGHLDLHTVPELSARFSSWPQWDTRSAVQCCFTSSEARTATSTFTQLLSSGILVVSDEVLLNVLRCKLTYSGQELWPVILWRPRKPEGSLGRTAQDGHLDSRTAPELWDTLMMMNWCLMSSDVSWHIRDKLWPMPKHGAINLYVHAQDVHLDSHTAPELCGILVRVPSLNSPTCNLWRNEPERFFVAGHGLNRRDLTSFPPRP